MDDTRYSYETTRDAICVSLGIQVKGNARTICKVIDVYNRERGKPTSRYMLTYTREDAAEIRKRLQEELKRIKEGRAYDNRAKEKKLELVEWLKNKEE